MLYEKVKKAFKNQGQKFYRTAKNIVKFGGITTNFVTGNKYKPQVDFVTGLTDKSLELHNSLTHPEIPINLKYNRINSFYNEYLKS